MRHILSCNRLPAQDLLGLSVQGQVFMEMFGGGGFRGWEEPEGAQKVPCKSSEFSQCFVASLLRALMHPWNRDMLPGIHCRSFELTNELLSTY